jgi:hypothetical protein
MNRLRAVLIERTAAQVAAVLTAIGVTLLATFWLGRHDRNRPADPAAVHDYLVFQDNKFAYRIEASAVTEKISVEGGVIDVVHTRCARIYILRTPGWPLLMQVVPTATCPD